MYIVISDSLYNVAADESALTFINKVASFFNRIVFLTCAGAGESNGILASMRTDGSDFKINRNFTFADQTNYGSQPLTMGAVLHDNGKIIFTMLSGGDYYSGAIVSFDTLTSTLTKIFSFPWVVGSSSSNATQPQIVNGKLVGLRSNGLYSVALNGTDYQQLNTLPLSGYPILNYETLTNSIFYITHGGVFKNTQLVKTDAVINIANTIHSFGNVPEGYNPDGIIRTPNGVLYGIARNGGSDGGGTLFKMNADGSAFSVIKDFAGNNGQSPVGQLLYASDGRLYGVCKRNGISGSSDSMLIYGIDVNGSNYSVLHLFETKTDGILIPELTESSSGEIAGLISPSNSFPPPPKIFKLKKNGTGFTVLKTLSLTGADGYFPRHGLVFYNGYFYGVNTTSGNSGQADGAIFRIREDGSNFSIVKYFHTGVLHGSRPEGGLTLGSDNKLYGVTWAGGSSGIGTAFSLNPSDLTFQVIHNFRFSDGFISVGKFTEASDGKLYITRESGIFGIDREGSNPVFASSQDYNVRPNENGLSYLTEIPLPVTTNICAPIASTILKSDIIGTNYQWQLNSGNGFFDIADDSNYVGTNTDSLKLSNIPSSFNGYQCRCLADGAASKTYTLKFINSWTGTLNNSWENPANWSCGSIPDGNTDVVINSGTVVVNSNVSIRSLKVDTGVNFTVNAGFVLSITH